MKYVDGLVLLAKEEVVLQSMTERLTEIRICYGMEMSAEKNESNENIMANIPNTDHDRSKTAGECGIFQLFGYHDNHRCKIYKEKTFHQRIGRTFKAETKCYSWCIALCGKANWSHTVQELPSQTCY